MREKAVIKRCLAMLLAFVMVVTGLTIPERNATAAEETNVVNYEEMSWQTLLERPENLTWVFAGDSITHVASHTDGLKGYVEWIEERLIEMGRASDAVINTSISGENLYNIKMDLEHYVTNYNPDVVFIAMGMNNRTKSSSRAYLADTLEERVIDFKEDYNIVIDGILSAGKDAGKVPKIVLLTPTPKMGDSLLNQNQFDEETVWPFSKATQAVAKANGLQCIDFTTAYVEEALVLGDDYNSTFFGGNSSDSTGLHPNYAGQYLMFKTISKDAELYDADSPLYQIEYEDLQDYALYPDATPTESTEDLTEMNKEMATVTGATPMAYVDFDATNGVFNGTLTDDNIVDLTTLKKGDVTIVDGDTLTLDEVQGLEKEYTVVLRAKLHSDGPQSNGGIFYVTTDKSKAYSATQSILAGVPNAKSQFSSNVYNATMLYTSSPSWYPTISATVAGEWHTIVMNHKEATTDIYVDGILMQTITKTSWKADNIGGLFTDENVTNFAAWFGRYMTGTTETAKDQHCLKANVDYVQYYSSALTDVQIQEVSNTEEDTDTVTGEITSAAVSTVVKGSYVWAIAGAEQMSTLETQNGHRTLFRQIENTLRQINTTWDDTRLVRAAAPGYTVSSILENYDELIGQFHPDALMVLPEVSEVYADNYNAENDHSAKVAQYKADVISLLKKDVSVKMLLTPLPSPDAEINAYIKDYAQAIREIAKANPEITFYDLNAYASNELSNDSMMRNWFGTGMNIQPVAAVEFAKAILGGLDEQGLGLSSYRNLVKFTYRESTSKYVFDKNYRTDNIEAEVTKLDGLYVTVDIQNILDEYADLENIRFALLPYLGCGNYNENIQFISDYEQNGSEYTFVVPEGNPVITVYGELEGKTWRFRDLALEVSATAEQINTAIASIGEVAEEDIVLISILEKTVQSSSESGLNTETLIEARSSYNALLAAKGVKFDSLCVVGAPEIELKEECNTYVIELYQYQRNIQILAEAREGLTITVDGKAVASGEYSQQIAVALGQTKDVKVAVSDGTSTLEYTLTVTRPLYPDIIVTEVMPNGGNYTYTKTDGTSASFDACDAIEIYNASGEDLNLRDYSIGFKTDCVDSKMEDDPYRTNWPYYFSGNTQGFSNTSIYTGINEIRKTANETDAEPIIFPADSTMVIWVNYAPNDAQDREAVYAALTNDWLRTNITNKSFSVNGNKVLPSDEQIVLANIPLTEQVGNQSNRLTTKIENNNKYFYLNNSTAIDASTTKFYRQWLFVLESDAVADSKGMITEEGNDILSSAIYSRISNSDNATSTTLVYNTERGISEMIATLVQNTFGAIEYTQKPLSLDDKQSATVIDNYEAGASEIELKIEDNTDIRYVELNVINADAEAYTKVSKDLVLETTANSSTGTATDITSYEYAYSVSATEEIEYYGYVVDGNGNVTEFGNVNVYKAQIGEKQYPSLEDAVIAANSMSGNITISLLQDVTVKGNIDIQNANGAIITIDGNGHTVTATGGNNTFRINNPQTNKVELKNMTIDHRNTGAAVQVNSVTPVALTNITIDATKGATYNYALINLLGTGKQATTTLNMTNVTVDMDVTTYNSDNSQAIIRTGNPSGTKTVKINLVGCTLDSSGAYGRCGIRIMSGTTATVTMEDSKIYTQNALPIYDHAGTATIDKVRCEMSIASTDGLVHMNGDTEEAFTTTYTETTATPAAQVGNTLYTSFTDALSATSAGDTIELFADVTIGTEANSTSSTDATARTGQISITKAITIDGNMHTLTTYAKHTIRIDYAGKVALRNLTFNCNQQQSLIQVNKLADLELRDVNIEVNNTNTSLFNYGLILVPVTGGDVTLNLTRVDVTMKTGAYGANAHAVVRTGNPDQVKNLNIILIDCNWDLTEADDRIGIYINSGATANVVMNNSIITTLNAVPIYNAASSSTIEKTNCTLHSTDKVAQIGTATYTDFASALTAANTATSDVTIELLQDITVGANNYIQNTTGANVTIDGNGHKVTATGGNNTFRIQSGQKGEVAFKNMTIVQQNYGAVVQLIDGMTGTVSLTDVIIDATNPNNTDGTYRYNLFAMLGSGEQTLNLTRVDITMVAPGNNNADKAIIRTGNGGEDKTVYLNFNDCNLNTSGATNRSGIVVATSNKAYIDLKNTSIKTLDTYAIKSSGDVKELNLTNSELTSLTKEYADSPIYGVDAEKITNNAGYGDGHDWLSVRYTNVTLFRSKDGLVAPSDIPNGYLFAGWFTDSTCEKALAYGDITTTSAYAKFVPEHVLTVKAQVSAHLLDSDTTDDATGSIRFITTVDTLRYREVGFKYKIELSTRTVEGVNKSDNVYKNIYAIGSQNGGVLSYVPKFVFCSQSEYFKAFTVKVGSSEYDAKMTVQPFWVTLDGTTVYGEEVTKTINQGIEASK